MVSFKGWAAAGLAAMGIAGTASAALVTITQTFYNSSSSTRRFSLRQTASASGIVSGTEYLIVGSVTATLTDLMGNGARLASSGGSPVYTASIDGVPVKELWIAPFELKVTTPFGSQSAAPESFSEPLPAGSSPLGLFGVDLVFDLSAGDTASVVATFDLVTVPGPGAAALLAIAGAAIPSTRRRKA
jgi:hypothetical protein